MRAVKKVPICRRTKSRRQCVWIVIYLLGVQLVFAESASAKGDQPIWKLPPEMIRDQVNSGVRAGANLKPTEWLNGAKVAVSISFDLDAEALWLGFYKQSSASYISRGAYGPRAGMPRIMALLDEHEIPATFFVPVMSMVLHPETLQQILARPRHELGFHSYVHENVIEFKGTEERETYEKALAKFTELTGKRPVGFRSGAWDLTAKTLDIVKDLGFLYDSSLMADDDPYRIVSNGVDSGIIELPIEWMLTDTPFFQGQWVNRLTPVKPTAEVFSIWSEEFDAAYRDGGMFILVLHPQVIGRRSRIEMLDRLITHMRSKPGEVWFATHEQIARHVNRRRK